MAAVVSPGPSVPASRLADADRWADPARPFLTFYDDRTGERTELSARTTANWVAKTANLGTDLLDLRAGDSVRLAVPSHWMVVVWTLAAVTAGWAVRPADPDGPTDPVDVLVGDAAGLRAPAAASARELVGVSTAPLARAFGPDLPAGALDYAAEVAGCADVFASADDPAAVQAANAPVLADAAAAADRLGLRPGSRLLVGIDPASTRGLVEAVLAPVLATASIVLVAGVVAGSARWHRLATTEDVTLELTD